MATSPPQPAAHAVLNTNELLCDIITRLKFKDVFAATAVCQTWRKALKDNLAIQQALFLALVEVRDILSEVDCLSMSLEDIPRNKYTIVGERHTHLPDTWTAGSPIYDYELRQMPIFKRPFGVWADMFVTQPPIKTVTVSMRLPWVRLYKALRDEQVDFECDTGVKLGGLHEFCRSLLQSNPKANRVSLSYRFEEKGYFGRWEVRNGKVVRQTRPRFIEIQDEMEF